MDACALLVARESKLGSGSDPGLAIIRFFFGLDCHAMGLQLHNRAFSKATTS